MKKLSFLLAPFLVFSCQSNLESSQILSQNCLAKFALNTPYQADGFDFPIGKPDGEDYYNAQGFGENYHLGEDWNGKGGGNTDFGDSVYSIANGYVKEAGKQSRGWGKVIRIVHCVNGKAVESLYAHFDKILVKEGDWVKRGQQIGTIGNAEGMYLAHLHLEIRTNTEMPLGGGYSKDNDGFVNPTEFIEVNRPEIEENALMYHLYGNDKPRKKTLFGSNLSLIPTFNSNLLTKFFA